MFLIEFGLNVITGLLVNTLDRFFQGISKTEINPKENILESNLKKNLKLFCTFDVYNDLERILQNIQEPVAHFLIENEPSTSWNLLCLVIECRLTGGWFVFERGRMTLQGMGGGISQTEIAVERLRKYNAPIEFWTISKAMLDELEEGSKQWAEIKTFVIPHFSSLDINTDWPYIQKKIKALLD